MQHLDNYFRSDMLIHLSLILLFILALMYLVRFQTIDRKEFYEDLFVDALLLFLMILGGSLCKLFFSLFVS
ncbi:hypothetical protein [Neisseria sp. Ec49-e6-T10]|uniref:hypothetical protein n=1 Tax=Neisseria sp. Ec49-e6-T10 TaxID=3140744 RepID=UPI003EBA211D